MIRNKFSRKEEKEYGEQERRRVAMVTIKGADQTRRGEGSLLSLTLSRRSRHRGTEEYIPFASRRPFIP